MIDNDELDARLLELLQTAIAPAPPMEEVKLTADTIYQALAEASKYKPRPTWVVPPGLTVDSSIPVDVIESPWPSDYVYVLPPERDPWG